MTPPRVLVVDDEPDVEALITQKYRRKVRKGEIHFLFARDGEQALDVLRANPGVDIVLSDINMPKMDGLTLLGRLKDRGDDLRAVMVSAYGDMGNIRTAMNRGAFDFVTKPIEFDDLETTIARALEHLRLFREMKAAREVAETAQATLSRYFSPDVVKALADDPEAMRSGGERLDATFLFTDLANFTPLVESSDGAVIVEILNEYLDGVTKIVFEHKGTVMKIIGDAVQAIFGAPVLYDDHARQAIDCAMAIDAFAMDFVARLSERGVELGVTRIGVNSGPAIIGNFGGERFFDYTAYGDVVNVAARLEAANKVFGTRVALGESTVESALGFTGRPIGTILLKGKSRGVKCYEPLTIDRAASPQITSYCEAFDLLEAGDVKAKQAFAALVGSYEEDPLALFHLGRILSGETSSEIDANP